MMTADNPLQFWSKSEDFNPDYANWLVPTVARLNGMSGPLQYEVITFGSSWTVVRHTRMETELQHSNILRTSVKVPVAKTYFHFFHVNRSNFEPFGKKSYIYCGTAIDLDEGLSAAELYYKNMHPELVMLDEEHCEQTRQTNKDYADWTVTNILSSIFKKGEQIQFKDCVFVYYGAPSWSGYRPSINDLIHWETAKGEKANKDFIDYLNSAQFKQIHRDSKVL